MSNAEEPVGAPVRHGSAAAGVGEEILSVAADIPWDTYLGEGAGDRITEGWLGVVRHAYPATAAGEMRAAATVTGQLAGDAAIQERLAAVGVAVAARHHRPARMPHREGEEPHAWWIAPERTLVWLPWSDVDEAPYGLHLLETGEADSVVVLAPEAIWTVFRSGLPRRGARGAWEELPERLQRAVIARLGSPPSRARWRRTGDTVTVSWRDGDAIRHVAIAVNRSRPEA